MPLDLTNPPFQRPAPHLRDDESLSSLGTSSVIATTARPRAGGLLDASLKLENMLLEEFNYASTTAYQAMEDRARFFNLYLVLVGILASGLGAAYQIGGEVRTYLFTLSIILLIGIGLLGTVFFLNLIRLRRAYRDSLICMNKIKEFYIEQFEAQFPNLKNVFSWRLDTIPSGEKFGNVTFLVVHTVAIIACFCYATAAFVTYEHIFGASLNTLVPALGGRIAYATATMIFLILLIAHISYYLRAFNRKKDERQRDSEVKRTRQALKRSQASGAIETEAQ